MKASSRTGLIPPLSIKVLLVLSLVLVALSCLLSVTYFTGQFKAAMNRQLYQDFDDVLARHTARIQNKVKQARVNVKRLAAMIRVLDLVKPKQALGYLRQVMEENIRYQPDEYNTYFALGPELARRYFGSPAFIYTVSKSRDDTSGRAALSAKIWRDPSYQTDPSQRWYQDTRTSTGCVVTKPYFDARYMRVWMFTVGQGIYRDGRFLGMAGIDILLERVLESVEKVSIGHSGGLLIVNRTDGKVLTRCQGGKSKFLDCPQRMTLDLYATRGGNATWMPILRQGVSQATVRGRDGRLYDVSAKVLTELPWAIVAFQSRAELQQPATRAAKRFALGAVLVIVLLTSVVLLVYGRSLASPLEELVAAMLRVKQTELQDLTAPVFGTVETRRLGTIFNEMIAAIAKTRQERESYYQQLEEANRTLEQRVQDRTLELSAKNEALESALRRVEETRAQLVVREKLASLGALTAGIAHEIKNPLNFVINFSELSKELLEELRENVEAILEAHPDEREPFEELLTTLERNATRVCDHGRRADSIVKNMLSHSRGGSGEWQTIDLNELVDEYVDLAYHGMRAADPSINVDLQKQFDAGAGQIQAVPGDLGRALVNLVNNALYAAKDARESRGDGFSPRVEVRTRDLGEQVEIRIRDNGAGISNEQLDQIFAPFFTTKPTGSGTGLGLSITHDIIVGVHAGDIRVESEPGSFAEFVIKLPRHYTG